MKRACEYMRSADSYHIIRGFGFIAREDGEPDVFVHVTSLSGSGTVLARGQRVLFDVGTDSRTGKEMAQNVRPL